MAQMQVVSKYLVTVNTAILAASDDKQLGISLRMTPVLTLKYFAELPQYIHALILEGI